MALGLLFDVHIHRNIYNGLISRGVNVFTTQELNLIKLPDSLLLDYATQNNLLIFTYDSDFLILAANNKKNKIDFSGIIYAKPLKIEIGRWINDLEIISKIGEYNDFKNQVIYLPF